MSGLQSARSIHFVGAFLLLVLVLIHVGLVLISDAFNSIERVASFADIQSGHGGW